MKCLNCGASLPKGSRPQRKYCDRACKQQYYRSKHRPQIKQRAKIPPSNGTGDAELDDILFMKVETTLRNTMLKELYDKRKEQGRQEAMQDADKWKEERTLDPATARKVADFLAEQYNPQGTS